MRTITVNFPQRIRLMQIVGGFQAAGLPALKACLELLQAVELNPYEANLIGFEKDVFLDRLSWKEELVKTLNPKYNVHLNPEQCKLLISIIEQHKGFQPSLDSFIPHIVECLNAPDITVGAAVE